MQITSQMPRPGAWKIFLIWASIGLQSFGGGTSTTFLIIREFVEKRHWMTMEDYLHLWSLCFFAPGINLVALTILIGKRLGGAMGVVAALAGMLLPSVIITCLLAAGFQLIQHLAAVQAILKGVIPATAGLMLLVAINTALPQLKTARKEGILSLMADIILIVLCALAIILWQIPVVVTLPTLAILGIILFTRPLFITKKEFQRHD